MNTEFKVSLTPKDDKPVYTQSLPVTINLKDDLTLELALMHRYGIITTLPFSKYASPISAQRKSNDLLDAADCSHCSQAYLCHQMADRRSVELLASDFASRTFAYRRLAQELSRALSAFASFMQDLIEPVIQADQCALYVDDLGIAANSPEQLMEIIRAVYK